MRLRAKNSFSVKRLFTRFNSDVATLYFSDKDVSVSFGWMSTYINNKTKTIIIIFIYLLFSFYFVWCLRLNLDSIWLIFKTSSQSSRTRAARRDTQNVKFDWIGDTQLPKGWEPLVFTIEHIIILRHQTQLFYSDSRCYVLLSTKLPKSDKWLKLRNR